MSPIDLMPSRVRHKQWIVTIPSLGVVSFKEKKAQSPFRSSGWSIQRGGEKRQKHHRHKTSACEEYAAEMCIMHHQKKTWRQNIQCTTRSHLMARIELKLQFNYRKQKFSGFAKDILCDSKITYFSDLFNKQRKSTQRSLLIVHKGWKKRNGSKCPLYMHVNGKRETILIYSMQSTARCPEGSIEWKKAVLFKELRLSGSKNGSRRTKKT